jgi:hypothetical protein
MSSKRKGKSDNKNHIVLVVHNQSNTRIHACLLSSKVSIEGPFRIAYLHLYYISHLSYKNRKNLLTFDICGSPRALCEQE